MMCSCKGEAVTETFDSGHRLGLDWMWLPVTWFPDTWLVYIYSWPEAMWPIQGASHYRISQPQPHMSTSSAYINAIIRNNQPRNFGSCHCWGKYNLRSGITRLEYHFIKQRNLRMVFHAAKVKVIISNEYALSLCISYCFDLPLQNLWGF